MIGNDPLDLDGQVAFITGAGQGAGRAIALALARTMRAASQSTTSLPNAPQPW